MTIYVPYNVNGFDVFVSPLTVRFEYLRILRVHGTIPLEILMSVVPPALEELHIEANALHLPIH